MDSNQFKEIRQTFPWTYRIDRGNVTIYDKNGRLIDLFLLIELMMFLTASLQEKK